MTASQFSDPAYIELSCATATGLDRTLVVRAPAVATESGMPGGVYAELTGTYADGSASYRMDVWRNWGAGSGMQRWIETPPRLVLLDQSPYSGGRCVPSGRALPPVNLGTVMARNDQYGIEWGDPLLAPKPTGAAVETFSWELTREDVEQFAITGMTGTIDGYGEALHRADYGKVGGDLDFPSAYFAGFLARFDSETDKAHNTTNTK
jgi:hypothetical protein